MTTRRSFLKLVSGASVALAGMPLMRALASPQTASDEFFIFLHAAGGWDVTVGLDPRNTHDGIVDPGSTNLIDIGPLKQWQSDATALDSGGYSFKLVRPPGLSPLVFGPGIGDLVKHYDRLTVINGLAMNTVSHEDGTNFSVSGRHLAAGKSIQSSIDTMVADAVGVDQLLPALSIAPYASSYVGHNLDRRAVPLQIAGPATLQASLRRSTAYEPPIMRDRVTAVLSDEASDLAKLAAEPDVMNGMHLQYEGLRRMMKENIIDAFSDTALKAAYPKFNYAQQGGSVNAAFADDLVRRNAVRCIAFAVSGFDTHTTNYRGQPMTQQLFFEMIGTMMDYFDTLPHPTKMGAKLSEHAHFLVTSDFCRTPMINVTLGRDHYPNNSFLVVSPRFKQNSVFGSTDPDQLLPVAARNFSDGVRAIAPPDVLATFVSAFGGEPHKYLRDGEVVPELLAT